MLPFGIGRKPAASDTCFLFFQFFDAPQKCESSDCQQSGRQKSSDAQRGKSADKPTDQKDRPDAAAKMIFCPDDNRVKDADQRKGK